MKRLGGIFLAFIMCVMVGIPAFAAEPQEPEMLTMSGMSFNCDAV